MHLNMRWTNTSHASEETKCISTFVERTPSSPKRTQNVSNKCWPNSSHASEDTKCVSTCVDKSPLKVMRTRNVSKLVFKPLQLGTQNISQHVLTKPVPCQREHKMHLILHIKPIPSTANTQNVSQNLMTKPLFCQQVDKMCHEDIRNPCQRGSKIYIKNCWLNPSHN